MNNEPVSYIPFAWYCAWLGDSAEPVWEQYEECHPSTKEWDNFPDKIIPLYTHPAKTLTPLTDDEIEIECRKAWNLNDQYRLNLEEVIRFAHAILRKAQEK